MPAFESLYVRLEPVLNVSYAQVDEMSYVLRKIGVPRRVVDVLPLIGQIPGFTQSCESTFMVGNWGIWPCENESRFGILRFDHSVRIEVLHFLVWRKDTFDSKRTFSGIGSGSISEHPVSKALGKIARREFARCMAIVSKMGT